VLGLVHAPAAVVEPLIAVSIIWVAVENMLGAGRLWRRFAVAFVFGLVHGLGFADALSPLVLTGWLLVRALAGFNLGVELGQMIAISLVLPSSADWRRRCWSIATRRSRLPRQEPTGWSSEFASNNDVRDRSASAALHSDQAIKRNARWVAEHQRCGSRCVRGCCFPCARSAAPLFRRSLSGAFST
jgi:hypothetical protein